MSAGYSTSLRNAQLDAITTAVGNAGKLALYDGVRPATGGAATTKLAEFTLGTPFSGAAAAAVLSPTLPAATTGIAAGVATWARITTSAAAFVIDLGVGTDITLNTTTISVGVNCTVTSFSITRGNA